MKSLSIICLGSLFLLFSCENDTTDAEAKSYCECVHENGNEDRKCLQLIEDYKVKYQFSEDAQVKLAEKMERCL